MAEGIKVKVVHTASEYRAWTDTAGVGNRPAFIAKTGEAPFFIMEGTDSFMWVCPGCGAGMMGKFGEQPVSGWDNPQWTREGDDEHLTLSPSLGCARWREGSCPGGHYWLRNGELVPV